jgi:hypothetical protein
LEQNFIKEIGGRAFDEVFNENTTLKKVNLKLNKGIGKIKDSDVLHSDIVKIQGSLLLLIERLL